MNYIIDEMRYEDWDQVSNIYLEGINTGNATFERNVPTWDRWDKGHVSACRLVARSGKIILGWAALSPISSREVYKGVAEVSIYIGEKFRGQGIASLLMKSLVEASEKNGFWTLQAGIFVENKASIALHEKFGFRVVGIREKLGKTTQGVWRDIAFLERRSKVVGI